MFDKISPDDLIFAFFPCIRFENQIMLWFRGQSASQKKWSLEEKFEFDMNLLKEVSFMYDLVNKMFIICTRKGLKLVMENPYSEEHFLRRYWCYSPAIIDRDRRDSGDYFKKPTQYWFVNFKPKNNLVFEAIDYVKTKIIAKSRVNDDGLSVKTQRSMIHPQYADRFIRQYILDEEIWRGKQ